MRNIPLVIKTQRNAPYCTSYTVHREKSQTVVALLIITNLRGDVESGVYVILIDWDKETSYYDYKEWLRLFWSIKMITTRAQERG